MDLDSLEELGVSRRDWAHLRSLPQGPAEDFLASLRLRVRHHWRELARVLHPDKTGGDQDSTDRFIRLDKARKDFDQIMLVHSQPMPYKTVQSTSPSSNKVSYRWTTPLQTLDIQSTSKRTATYVSMGSARRVATMRP